MKAVYDKLSSLQIAAGPPVGGCGTKEKQYYEQDSGDDFGHVTTTITGNYHNHICARGMVFMYCSIQVSTFADMEGEETFEPSLLGHAEEVVEERIADDDVIMVKGTKNSSSVSSCTQF